MSDALLKSACVRKSARSQERADALDHWRNARMACDEVRREHAHRFKNYSTGYWENSDESWQHYREFVRPADIRLDHASGVFRTKYYCTSAELDYVNAPSLPNFNPALPVDDAS
ncbi:MAG: hypothetical protein AAF317_00070 [Pseudomonadota bacterium]